MAGKLGLLEDQLKESRGARSQIQKGCQKIESLIDKEHADKNSAIENLKSMIKFPTSN